jgi:hypothetical protein
MAFMMSSPEPQPNRITKVKNLFLCQIVKVKPGQKLIVVQAMSLFPSASIAENRMLVAVFFVCCLDIKLSISNVLDANKNLVSLKWSTRHRHHNYSFFAGGGGGGGGGFSILGTCPFTSP